MCQHGRDEQIGHAQLLRCCDTGHHDWAGGNDIQYCRTCGVEYDWRKEHNAPNPVNDAVACGVEVET
jgi:hypothetical protein